MIDSVYVENFMRIDERVSLDLSPVTVLVGGNGSGKSSVLKALHWAVRCAALRDWRGNTTLEQMDYTPSRAFQELAHKKRIQNKADLPKIKIGFIDTAGNATEIAISSARNDAGAKVSIDGPLETTLTSENPATSYIPGIAGLAEFETVLAAPILHRRASSGEGGSVLRHILLDLAGTAAGGTEYVELNELAEWVSKVLPGSQFWVKFDRIRDVRIDALFLTPAMREVGRTIANQRRPLEMAGTGYLQVVQIFAYLLKFRPSLLLIDEPDAHLHPGTQERLISALEEAAVAFPETKFLITTHSPHLVRNCGPRTSVQWMEDGKLRRDDESTIRLRMGWGSLDKEIMIFTEDDDVSAIQAILSQWPDLARRVLLWPTFGQSGIPHGKTIAKLRDRHGIPVLIHRDRDFMSDTDVDAWEDKRGLTEYDVPLWTPDGSDIESCFCSPRHVAAALNVLDPVAERIVENAIASFNERDVRMDFENALSGAINILPAETRSSLGARWTELGALGAATIKGKVLLKAIERSTREEFIANHEPRSLALLPRLRQPLRGMEIGTSLKTEIEQVLGR